MDGNCHPSYEKVYEVIEMPTIQIAETLFSAGVEFNLRPSHKVVKLGLGNSIEYYGKSSTHLTVRNDEQDALVNLLFDPDSLFLVSWSLPAHNE